MTAADETAGSWQAIGMCGRFYLYSTGAAVADLFDLAGPVEVTLQYNIAASQPAAVVRLGEHGLELVPLRWGLIPSWAKDAKFAPINARSETAAEKPTFRNAMRKRRCLLPANGFYEWTHQGKAKLFVTKRVPLSQTASRSMPPV